LIKLLIYNKGMQIFADKQFENPTEIIQAFDNKSFIDSFARIEFLRKQPNTYLLGYIRYEAKEIFLGRKIESKFPLLYFEAYQEGKKAGGQEGKSAVTLSPVAQIDYPAYKKAIEKIKEEIACGNTYQVNYTYDYKIETEGETDLGGFELYNSILPNQKTPYNSYIKNEFEEILCFSPELFFELENNKIKTKPMKGTAKRGETRVQDEANIEFLKNDEKNRAENVMIVDLLRNDLGKIAKTGTVKVEKLFEVETHKTLHQMTSEVSAELDEKITLYEIFDAIFPCGSITGAPKINTMKIIDELEVGSRDVYCGAIGLITPEKALFTVPIRTLQHKLEEDFFSCRVGGAIVWDSTPEDEWEETLTKIKFLQQAPRSHVSLSKNEQKFSLVETILVKNREFVYQEDHIARMKKSAKELGFKFDSDVLRKKLNNEIKKEEKDFILRVLLSNDGAVGFQNLPFEPIKTNKVTISKTQIHSSEKLLYYKSTYRPWYDEAMQKIKAGEVFDEIFFNQNGELTEGARSNVLLKIDGEMFTPNVGCGLLKGIMRQKMIKNGGIKEKKLYLDDLKKAEKVFCVNSVRGIVEVEVDFGK